MWVSRQIVGQLGMCGRLVAKFKAKKLNVMELDKLTQCGCSLVIVIVAEYSHRL